MILINNKDTRLSCLVLIYVGLYLIKPENAFAFNKLKNGFETLTNNYLMPLTGVVAGAALITFITLSYFKQEEAKKAASVVGLCVFSAVGLDLIKTLTQSFG